MIHQVLQMGGMVPRCDLFKGIVLLVGNVLVVILKNNGYIGVNMVRVIFLEKSLHF